MDRGSGNYNYGWVLLDYNDTGNTLGLLALAIESDQNVSIFAGVPEPASITLLGFGGLLLVLRRGRR